MAEEREQPVFVYMIDQKAHVKIGISNDPQRRLRELQVGNPHPLHLLGAFKCSNLESAKMFEKTFHDLFNHLLVGGEWFDLSDPFSPTRPQILWLHFVEYLVIALERVTGEWEELVKGGRDAD